MRPDGRFPVPEDGDDDAPPSSRLSASFGVRPSQPGEEPLHIEVPPLGNPVSLVGTGERPAYVPGMASTQRASAPDGIIPVSPTIDVGEASAPDSLPSPMQATDVAGGADAPVEASADGAAPTGPEEAPSFADALGSPVRLLGTRVPLWGPIGALAGIAAVPGLVVALAGISGLTGGVVAGAALRDSPSASAAASTTATPPSHIGIASRAAPRAAAGGLAAGPEMLKALEARPATERTPGETLLLGRSLDAQASSKVTDLARALEQDPRLLADPRTATSLIGYSRDPRTAMAAIELMVRLPAPLGPDLLYEAWTGVAERTDATRVAQELLLSKEIRSRASPALGLAIDLRTLELCGDLLPVVEQAAEQADRRALPALTKLENRLGCGPNQRDDCYACLRDNPRLARAVERARRTPAPVYK